MTQKNLDTQRRTRFPLSVMCKQLTLFHPYILCSGSEITSILRGLFLSDTRGGLTFFFFYSSSNMSSFPSKTSSRKETIFREKKKESRFNEISRKKLAIIPVPTYNRKHLLIVIVSEYTVRGERYN